MALTPQRRADSPRERLHDDVVPIDVTTATVLDVPPPSPDEPQYSYRTLCAVRMLLEALDVYLLQREPFGTQGGRKHIHRLRKSIAAHVANLVVAAEHESYLHELDVAFRTEKGGEA